MRRGPPVKTIYIPYLSDHANVLAAALQSHGMPAEALPPADDESLKIGMDLCGGRECLPCFVSTGDIIRRARRPDFDSSRAILLIPDATGLCRFGLYRALHRAILDEQGLSEVEIVSPSANNSYQGFGEQPTALRRLIWRGIVATDLLQKLLHEYRPYERAAGQTDEAYRTSLSEIVEATRLGGRTLISAMRRAAKRFECLPAERRERRPLIGLVGEIYVRLNEFSNQQLMRKIEATGGEVVVATMIEWLYCTNWICAERARAFGDWGEWLGTLLSDFIQRRDELSLCRPVEHLLRDPRETPIKDLMRNLRPHYEPLLGLETEAGLSLGKAVDLAGKGLSGVLNVMPFGCMPGIVVAGMAPRYRAGLDNIPWLDLSFEAQRETNITTRLEAFMHQARQYQARRRAATVSPPAG